jgi:hypothetical protein
MNPLGLLAGLGALNALSGGELGAMFGGKAATGKRFTGLMDMLDGGGAGASGNKFEGGGLLSALGNLFAKPLEAQDNVEKIAARTSARNMLRPKLRPEGLLSEAQKEQIVMNQIVNPDVYGIGRGGEFAGSMLAPRATTAQSAPAPSYATMPMGEAGRGMPDMPLPRVGNQAVPLRTRGAEFYDQPNITPDYAGDYTRRQDYSTKTPYPSGMSPAAPSMPQGVMSFREFVDAERAAMSGADLYVDPANYRRGYARYLSSMGINPATMGM